MFPAYSLNIPAFWDQQRIVSGKYDVQYPVHNTSYAICWVFTTECLWHTKLSYVNTTNISSLHSFHGMICKGETEHKHITSSPTSLLTHSNLASISNISTCSHKVCSATSILHDNMLGDNSSNSLWKIPQGSGKVYGKYRNEYSLQQSCDLPIMCHVTWYQCTTCSHC